jgi:hypothetical protein
MAKILTPVGWYCLDPTGQDEFRTLCDFWLVVHHIILYNGLPDCGTSEESVGE